VSKVEKLRKRAGEIPSDFTWDEMVSLLNSFGFEETSKKGGSYRCFLSSDGRKFFMHKPHPGSIVKQYALRQVVEKLCEFGLLQNGE
jgi:predicted RNA binding protein YcfA (HicA-like mRNA interferase family)